MSYEINYSKLEENIERTFEKYYKDRTNANRNAFYDSQRVAQLSLSQDRIRIIIDNKLKQLQKDSKL